MELKVSDINYAFHRLVKIVNAQSNESELSSGTGLISETNSRNGKVLMFTEPVTVTYTQPTRRVLFNRYRHANPFFHLYESLWMLAGRNDVAPLRVYNSKIGQFSDDGKTFNGAYGYRWRHHSYWDDRQDIPGDPWINEVDQLSIIANHLKALPNSRRAVLNMWNVADDLLKIGMQDTTTEANKEFRTYLPPSKDVCCNLNVMFSLRMLTSGALGFVEHIPPTFALDMTVVNRSNDMIWGMLGANYVHFSILQEYMAAKIGVGVGNYTQFSNNLHVYGWNWKPEEWLKAYETPESANLSWYDTRQIHGLDTTVQLVKDPEAFDKELPVVVEYFGCGLNRCMRDPTVECTEPFFKNVARPMFRAYLCYKDDMRDEAFRHLEDVMAPDWQLAGNQWLEKVYSDRNAKCQP